MADSRSPVRHFERQLEKTDAQSQVISGDSQPKSAARSKKYERLSCFQRRRQHFACLIKFLQQPFDMYPGPQPGGEGQVILIIDNENLRAWKARAVQFLAESRRLLDFI